MDAVKSICEPKRWYTLGKYLFPVGLSPRPGDRVATPQEQVPLAVLASDHPNQVSLQVLGNAIAVAQYDYPCYSEGSEETNSLPMHFASPAFVAEIQGGMSFGRHCCVIGPDQKAVRETGFNLDGNVTTGATRLATFSPRYWRKRWEGDLTQRPWLPRRSRVAGSVAVLNARYSHNYYHWLTEILPRLATLKRAGLEADYYLVESRSNFQKGVLADLGIRGEQLIQPHCRLLLEAETMLVPSMPTATCLREFSGMLSAGLGLSSVENRTRRIFITRAKTGTRTLENESELVKLLEDWGFESHAMEEYPLEKQASLMREAEVVVATHGAGLANLIFAQAGTNVIEIVPAGRYNAACYPRISRAFSLEHQQIFSRSARTRQRLTVSLEDVACALNRALPPAALRIAA